MFHTYDLPPIFAIQNLGVTALPVVINVFTANPTFGPVVITC
jgi:hypothetical protein